MAIAYLAADNMDAYRTVCSEMLARFSLTTDPYVTQRIGYACVPAQQTSDSCSSVINCAKLVPANWSDSHRRESVPEFMFHEEPAGETIDGPPRVIRSSWTRRNQLAPPFQYQ